MENALKPIMLNVLRPTVPGSVTALPPSRNTVTESAASFRTNSQSVPIVLRTLDAYGTAQAEIDCPAANNKVSAASR